MMLRALCLLCVLYGLDASVYTCNAPTELYTAGSPGYCPLNPIENPGTSINNAYTSNQYCGKNGQILISWYAAADQNNQLDAYMYCCALTTYTDSACYVASAGKAAVLYQPIGPYDGNSYTFTSVYKYSDGSYTIRPCWSQYGFYGYTAYYYSTGSSSRIVGLTLFPVDPVRL